MMKLSALMLLALPLLASAKMRGQSKKNKAIEMFPSSRALKMDDSGGGMEMGMDGDDSGGGMGMDGGGGNGSCPDVDVSENPFTFASRQKACC